MNVGTTLLLAACGFPIVAGLGLGFMPNPIVWAAWTAIGLSLHGFNLKFGRL